MLNASGFCHWLSGVLDMKADSGLTVDEVTLVRKRLSEAFLNDIDQQYPPEQQAALHAAHIGVKMGRDGVTPDTGLHFDKNSWEYEPGARC